MARRDDYSDVAKSIPFDNGTNGFSSDDVQDAIEELAASTNHPHKHIIHVDKLGNDTTGAGTPHNPYLTIAKAISTITDAADDNRYLIQVGAGIFEETVLNVPAYVSISGAGINVTIVSPSASTHNVFNIDTLTDISFLTISGAAAGYAAVDASNCGDFALLHKISIFDCDIGIEYLASTKDSQLYLEYVDINGDYTRAVNISSSGGFEAFCNAENFYCFLGGSTAVTQIKVDGVASKFSFLSGGVDGNSLDTGVLITNGGKVTIKNTQFRTSGLSIYADTNGTGSKLNMSAVVFADDCVQCMDIANADISGYFFGYVPYLKKSINKLNSFFIANKDGKIVTVAKKGGDFDSIYDALETVKAEKSVGEYWGINVGPGAYSEPLLELESEISLIALTDELTSISPDGDHDIIHINGSHAAIYNIELEDAPTGRWAVKIDNATSQDIELINMEIKDCDYGVYVRTVDTFVDLHLTHVDINGNYSKGIEVIATNGNSTFVDLNGVTLDCTKSGMSNAHLSVTGVGARVEAETVRITGVYNDGGATDVGVQIADGAQYRTNGPYIRHCYKGLYCPSGGTAPDIKANALRLNNNFLDLDIQHTTTQGVFNGIAKRSKITNLATQTLLLTYSDPSDGDYNITRILATRGFATDLTSIVTANQTTQMISYDAHTYILTGSTAGQILRLPDATTLRVGHQFYILNESSVSVTVQTFGGALDQTLLKETNTLKILRDNTTAAGVWTKSVGVNFAAGKLRDPRIFAMNGTVGNGDWISISNLIDDYKYVFTEEVKLIGMEWSNSNGSGRDFDLVFYKNGIAAGNIIRTYQVRNSTFDYGSATGWTDLFGIGDYMRVMYIDQGDNVSDFGGRFNFEVVT